MKIFKLATTILILMMQFQSMDEELTTQSFRLNGFEGQNFGRDDN